MLVREHEVREAANRERVALIGGLLRIGEHLGRLVQAVEILRELVEMARADAGMLDPRSGVEAMHTYVDAPVAAAPNEHRCGREVAVQNARAVAVRDRLNDLLQQYEPLVEREIRLLP